MEWAVLPNPGGLYQQHPQLIEEWGVIFEERSKYEKEQAKSREEKAKGSGAGRSLRNRK